MVNKPNFFDKNEIMDLSKMSVVDESKVPEVVRAYRARLPRYVKLPYKDNLVDYEMSSIDKLSKIGRSTKWIRILDWYPEDMKHPEMMYLSSRPLMQSLMDEETMTGDFNKNLKVKNRHADLNRFNNLEASMRMHNAHIPNMSRMHIIEARGFTSQVTGIRIGNPYTNTRYYDYSMLNYADDPNLFADNCFVSGSVADFSSDYLSSSATQDIMNLFAINGSIMNTPTVLPTTKHIREADSNYIDCFDSLHEAVTAEIPYLINFDDGVPTHEDKSKRYNTIVFVPATPLLHNYLKRLEERKLDLTKYHSIKDIPMRETREGRLKHTLVNPARVNISIDEYKMELEQYTEQPTIFIMKLNK